MEKFFEAGTLTQEELVSGLATATAAAKMFPVVCASGLQNMGAQPLMDAIARIPALARRAAVQGLAGSETVTRTADEGAPYAAFVWKTVADQFAGRITMFRVYQGALKADSTVTQPHPGEPERLGHLIVLQGKTPVHVPELKAGDLGAVAKLKDTRTNDTIADKAPASPSCRCVSRAGALLRDRAEEPRRRRQDQHAMHRLEEEDGRSATRAIRRPRAAARRTGPAAHRGHRRQAEAALRRRGDPQAAAHSLSRDHHRARRGARPPQEADRRTRAVRRLQDPHGAAAARQRFRVRRRDLRRLDSAAIHSGRRKGNPGITAARLPRRLSRSWTSASCSSTGSITTWIQTSSRSRPRGGWRSRTGCRRPSRRCSSRSWTSRSTRRATTPAT